MGVLAFFLRGKCEKMKVYENVATVAIASFFYNEPLWKKEILFNFLLKPFELAVCDIKDVATQDNLQVTIPDFTIKTDKKNIRFEVKINDSALTDSEKEAGNRDAFLVRKNYAHLSEIPVSKDKVLYWEDLFELIDKKGITNEFARLSLVREYMNATNHTLLLTPHEVAMLYSPETISAVYTMSNKVFKLCENFLNSHQKEYDCGVRQQNEYGIGYSFKENKGKNRAFFVGINPCAPNPYDFSIALELNGKVNCNTDCYSDDGYAYFPLDKEILAKYNSEEDLQEQFNKNVEEVIARIV